MPEAASAMTSAIEQLDGDIKAAHATVHERALTLAGLQQVRAAVATDAATAKDMVARGELKFDPAPGEVIELGQAKAGDPAITLLIQPEGGMRSSHAGKVGSYAELMGDQIVVTEVAPVTPKQHDSPFTGYVMVSRPLDLGPAIAKLEQARASAARSRSTASPCRSARRRRVRRDRARCRSRRSPARSSSSPCRR